MTVGENWLVCRKPTGWSACYRSHGLGSTLEINVNLHVTHLAFDCGWMPSTGNHQRHCEANLF